MANFSATYSGDLTMYLAGKIFDAANMAKGEKQRAVKEAEKYGVDPELKRGEFFGRALQSQFGGDLYNRTLGIFDPRKTHRETDRRGSRESRFGAQFRYPDKFMRGQSTPFASPLANDYFNRGQSSPITAQAKERRAGNPFPFVAAGAPLSSQATPKPSTPMTATARPEDMFGGKDDSVKVKDKKLGVFLAAVAQSINNSVSSINDKLDETESGVIQAKDTIAGTIKQLEQSSSSLEDRLDAIIAALREQLSTAKENTDKSEVKEKAFELGKKADLSGTERIAGVGEDADEAKAKAQKQDEQSQPYGGYNDMGIGYERGGIVSGPNSGYMLNEPLHGTEMIIPLDNNFTRGLPSAVGPSMFEKGTTGTTVNINTNVTAKTKPVGQAVLPQILKADPTNEKEVDDAISDLGDALKGVVQTAGIVTLGQLSNAVTEIPAAGLVADELKQTGKAISDKFGVRNTITDRLVRRVNAQNTEKKKAKAVVSAPSQSNQKDGVQKSSGGFNIFNPLTWFNNWGRGNNNNQGGQGGPGAVYNRMTGGSGGYGGGGTRGGKPGGQGGPFSWLPGTGRVMAPSGSQYNSRGGTVQKLFGMTVPGSYQRSGYKQEDIDRFNRTSQTQYLEQYKAQPLAPSPELEAMYSKYGIQYTDPAHRVRSRTKRNPNVSPQQGAITGANNTRLNQAIQDANRIGDMTGTRGLMDSTADTARKTQNRYDVLRQYMRDNNMSGADQNMNIYGKPMGNQSSLGSPSGKMNSVAMLNMASQQNALSRMGGGSGNLEPIVINNTQQASAQEDDIPHSPITTVGDAGISAFYPSPFA
jgi:hypothetical protein